MSMKNIMDIARKNHVVNMIRKAGWKHQILTDYRFASPRRWTFDVALLDESNECRGAVDIHGGTWFKIGHTHPTNFARDREKANEAALKGILYLEFSDVHFKEKRIKENYIEMTIRKMVKKLIILENWLSTFVNENREFTD